MADWLTNKTWLDKLRELRRRHLLPFFLWSIRRKIEEDYFSEHPQFCLAYFPRYYGLHRELTFGELLAGIEASTLDNPDINEAESLASDFATFWIYEHVKIYDSFAGLLRQISEDFEQITHIDHNLSRDLVSETIPQHGAVATFVFVILMSVLLHKEVLDELVQQSDRDRQCLQYDNESVLHRNSKKSAGPSSERSERPRLTQSEGIAVQKPKSEQTTPEKKLNISDSFTPKAINDAFLVGSLPTLRSDPAALVKSAHRRIRGLSPDVINKRHSFQLTNFAGLISPPMIPHGHTTGSFGRSLPRLATSGSIPRNLAGALEEDDESSYSDDDVMQLHQQTAPDFDRSRGENLLRTSRNASASQAAPSPAEDQYKRFLKRKDLEAYLLKQTRNRHPRNELKYDGKLWKKRWVILKGDRLCYFRNEDCEESKGILPLYMIECVRTCPRFGPFAFQIDAPGRSFYFKTESEEQKHQWLFALQCAFAINLESFTAPEMRIKRQHIALIKKWWKHAANWDKFSLASSDEDIITIPLPSVESYDGGALKIDVVTCSKQGFREYMEDFALVAPEFTAVFAAQPFVCSITAVFDGHGGVEAAAYCKEHLLQEFAETIARLGPVDMAKAAETDNKSGTTATVVCITETHIHLANVGDSQAVLCRDGQALVLTQEHKPGLPSEKERILRAGGVVEENREINLAKLYKINPEILAAEQIPHKLADAVGFITNFRVMGQLSVSRAIGDAEYKGDLKHSFWGDQYHFSSDLVIAEPHVVSLPRTKGDEFVVLASDGLWDVLLPQQVVDYIRGHIEKQTQAQIVTENLVLKALGQGTQDNVTAAACFLVNKPSDTEPKSTKLL